MKPVSTSTFVETVVSAWPAAVVAYATERGGHRARLLAAAGLSEQQLADPAGRVTCVETAALWVEAERQLKDPDLGLSFASALRDQQPFGLLGHLCRTARTRGEVLGAIGRFHALVGLRRATLTTTDSRVTLGLELHEHAVASRQISEAIVGALVTMGHRSTGLVVKPLEVRLAHPAPANTEAHRRILGSVRFDAVAYAIDWPLEALGAKLLPLDGTVSRYFQAAAARELVEVQHLSLVATVTDTVVGLLPQGGPTIQQVGRRLGYSARTLQRRLREQGVTFSEVVDEARMRLALQLLDRPRLTLGEISARLGFGDGSAFRRAFLRWRGRSLADERRRRRAGGLVELAAG